RADWKRARAIEGNHPSALQLKSGRTSVRLDPTYTVLHDFAGGANDGSDPTAGVTLDSDGNIYSTTEFGGTAGDGTIFMLAPDGTETLLYSFHGNDGSAPDGAVTLSNGNLY